jgi:voltage-gated sodium channel
MPPVQRTARRIVDADAFSWLVAAVILANAAALGLETYPQIARDAGGALDAVNQGALAFFVVELAIRFAACGRRPQDFFRSGWNVFDFVVVGAAFVPGLRENTTLLRLARLARVVRIVRLLPDLRVLVVAIARTLPGMVSLAVIAVLALYVYGMVGWIIFGGEDPRYATIGEAMFTLFLLLSLEDLPSIVAEGREITRWAVPFYASFVVVSALLLLNILIGIVINSMEEARQLEWAREQQERRAAAAATEDPRDDHELDVLDRVAELRRALDDLERDLRGV